MRFLLGFILGLIIGGLASIVIESQRAAMAAESGNGHGAGHPSPTANPAG